MGKPVQNGIGEQSSKVLVSLEDFTSLRGEELLQGLYVVVLGYNMDMKNASKRTLEISKIKSTIKEDIRERIEQANTKQNNTIDNTITEILKESAKSIIPKRSVPNFAKEKSIFIQNNHAITNLTQAIPVISEIISEAAINSHKNESLEMIKNEISGSTDYTKQTSSLHLNQPLDAISILIDKTPKQSTIGDGRKSIIYTNKADDFFFCWHSPVMMVQRGRQYQFSNGYPLFYGTPKRQASIYVAVLDIADTDPKGICNLNQAGLLPPGAGSLEGAIEAFQSIHYDLSSILSEERKTLVYLEDRERKIHESFEIIKTAFSLLIKAFETRALNLKHQIRYTNVLTLKENDEWLEGGHQDWGDQRMAMTIKVEVSK